MFQVLPLQTKIYIIAALSVLLIGSIVTLLAVFNEGQNALVCMQITFGMLVKVSIVSGLIVWIGHSKKWWRSTWKRFPFLNERVFPDLNGEWKGATYSNWPIIKSMSDAAKSAEQSFDVSSQNNIDLLQKNEVVVKIDQNWLRIKITLNSGQNTSSTRHVTAYKEGDKHKISYIYTQQTQDLDTRTDLDSHDGAAILEVITQGDDIVLQGVYWSNRSWASGYNTAGRIELRKVK